MTEGGRKPGKAGADRSEGFGERLLGVLLDRAHEMPPRLIAPLVAEEAARVGGRDLSILLQDYEQMLLVPLPGRQAYGSWAEFSRTHTAGDPMPVLAPDFAQLFAPGTSHAFPDADGSLLVRVLPGVPLSLPSGRVIAMEPSCFGEDDPAEMAFTEQVRPGTYPVVLIVVNLIGPDGEDRGNSRVAAARLEIRDAPVATWELAVTPGDDLDELEDDEVFGYPVDAGTGCFVDAQTFGALGDDEEFAEEVLSARFDRDPRIPATDPITMPVGDDDHALIAFSTGWGDGSYSTWIGRTADGDVACFLTDFEVLPEEDDE
nr:DUF4241 domain-containing protein [Streptomyces sp. NBC_00857]